MSEPQATQRISLQAGPVSMVFEPAAAFLRYVRLGSDEILRGVYAAVRDRNWGTVSPRIRDLKVRQDGRSFEVSFEAICREGDIDFAWQGRLSGAADGTVAYEFDGQAHSTFLRNRIGFCVLHPIAPCAGKPCRVRTTDGQVRQAAFPQRISAHQPLKDLRSIAHEVRGGVWAEVVFEGDVFEMEDQRNWTDASYKTYCTPLGLPFPVEAPKGTRIRQSVTMRLEGPAQGKGGRAPVAAKAPKAVELAVDWDRRVELPRLGLGLASHGQPLTQRQVQRLKALNLDHLRVDLPLSSSTWPATLEQACDQSRQLDCSLQVALMLTDDAPAQLNDLLQHVRRLRPAVAHWLVFHVGEKSTSPRWVELAAKQLRSYDEAAWIAAGANAYFAELNRGPRPADAADAVCYSINPQVHAFDDASLVETLMAQGYTVDSARHLAGGKPILVTPVTLRPRFNPNATGPEPPTPPGELPSQVDPRQATLFGAGWTMGSLKYLSLARAAAVTYYETTGWRGVMERDEGSPLPARFASLAGGVFPLYHVLAGAGRFVGGAVAAVSSADSLAVDGLALARGSDRCLLVANLTDQLRQARISWPKLKQVQVRPMDESNLQAAMATPEEFRRSAAGAVIATGGKIKLDLPPHALVRLDVT